MSYYPPKAKAKTHHKRNAQMVHAISRAWERFGLRLSQQEYVVLCRTITTNQARFIRRQSCRVALFELEINEVKVVAVYDSSRHSIVTFLTPEMVGADGNAFII